MTREPDVLIPGDPGEMPPARPAVLLVEDEPTLRGLFTRVLTRGGFDVAAFGDGTGALESVVTRPDLLLTDITVPGRTGTQVADAVVARFPGTPVLFMSGYGLAAATADQLVPLDADLITKPFTGGELVQRVRAALAAAGRQPVRPPTRR